MTTEEKMHEILTKIIKNKRVHWEFNVNPTETICSLHFQYKIYDSDHEVWETEDAFVLVREMSKGKLEEAKSLLIDDLYELLVLGTV